MTRFNISLQEGVEMVLSVIEKARGGELFVPKIPSYRVGDVAEAIGPECEKPVIGIRPGEKIHEEMITTSDSFNTVDLGQYYAILPTTGKQSPQNYCGENGYKMVTPGFAFNSGTNPYFLTVEELRQLIQLHVDPNFTV
jgi:FlaA1/EpsC-like NDP-sugar epimerase